MLRLYPPFDLGSAEIDRLSAGAPLAPGAARPGGDFLLVDILTLVWPWATTGLDRLVGEGEGLDRLDPPVDVDLEEDDAVGAANLKKNRKILA